VIMGPLGNVHYSGLKDARWNEKFAAGILIIGIIAIGVAPFWLNNLITPGTEHIVEHGISSLSLK